MTNATDKDKNNVINTKTVRIGTWNIRSIYGKEFELIEQMENMKLDMLGITETKKKKKGMTRLSEEYWLY